MVLNTEFKIFPRPTKNIHLSSVMRCFSNLMLFGFSFLFVAAISSSTASAMSPLDECESFNVAEVSSNLKQLQEKTRNNMWDVSPQLFGPAGVFVFAPDEEKKVISDSIAQYSDPIFVRLEFDRVGFSNVVVVYLKNRSDLMSINKQNEVHDFIKRVVTLHYLVNWPAAAENSINSILDSVRNYMLLMSSDDPILQYQRQDNRFTRLRIVVVLMDDYLNKIMPEYHHFSRIELVSKILGAALYSDYANSLATNGNNKATSLYTPNDKWMMRTLFFNSDETDVSKRAFILKTLCSKLN